MKYSIIDTEKGEEYDIKPHLHQLLANGSMMVVNENELRLVNSDIDRAAELLGGEVLSEAEVINEMKEYKT